MPATDEKRLRWLGIDMRAWYRYGKEFEALPEEQQQEMLLHYKVGNYLMPYKKRVGPNDPDEREVAERNRASHRALQFLALVMVCMATGSHRGLRSDEMLTALFLQIAVTALTLPKAIILWTEADPRESGDLELVSGMKEA